MGDPIPKVPYNQKRKKRKSDRVKFKNKPVTELEEQLQQDADRLYSDLGIRTLRIPDSLFKTIFSGFGHLFDILRGICGNFGGWSDNTLLLKDGRFICIELKSDSGFQDTDQKNFENDVGADNYYICRNIDEVHDVLKEYGVIVK